MKKVLIINGHQPFSFSPGRLNGSMVERAKAKFEAAGAEVKVTETAGSYEVDEELARHQWADLIIVQYPVNWMGVPWSLKKYMDEVYTAGMDGRLATGDGRHTAAPKKNYGFGGALAGVRFMQSVTFNAPHEAFGDPEETFFAGASVDDLLWPTELVFRFVGAEPLPTFAAYDVMKNPEIEADFARFDAHLDAILNTEATAAVA